MVVVMMVYRPCRRSCWFWTVVLWYRFGRIPAPLSSSTSRSLVAGYCVWVLPILFVSSSRSSRWSGSSSRKSLHAALTLAGAVTYLPAG